jgi:hypothetical protein
MPMRDLTLDKPHQPISSIRDQCIVSGKHLRRWQWAGKARLLNKLENKFSILRRELLKRLGQLGTCCSTRIVSEVGADSVGFTDIQALLQLLHRITHDRN